MNKIYIYETPLSKKYNNKKEQLIKIGQTSRAVHQRIKEQLDTASAFSKKDTEYILLYEIETNITDKQIHKILDNKGIERSRENKEWFFINYKKVIFLINELISGKKPEEIDINRINSFEMRPEQKMAVEKTKKYFKTNLNPNFLWNAKMRFGKTFTAYNLMKELDFKKVLILTYKPAVHKQWKVDLEEHISFKDYMFLSVKDNNLNRINKYEKSVCFMSYQDMIGTDKNNNIKEKHKEIYNTNWDLIIIDEFHYGSDTFRANSLFSNDEKIEERIELDEEIQKIKELELDIKEEKDRIEELEKTYELNKKLSIINFKHKLYLSGTPFKALQNKIFSKEQIFNWTYIDEQKAKEAFKNKKYNPYKELPSIHLFIYRLSDELIKLAQKENKDEEIGFSLNYFFNAINKDKNKEPYFINNGKNNDHNINLWLDNISGINKNKGTIKEQLDDLDNNEKEDENINNFPYNKNSKKNLIHLNNKKYHYPNIEELNHTLWFMPNVASVLAMKKLLEKHPFFEKYKIIAAVGGKMSSGAKGLSELEPILENNDKTITLSCGMLTTGVSIPKWTAVLFLRDIESPESYFQTAFRAQTPYKDINGKILKKYCYIFDFSPVRSLRLLTEYSDKLLDDKNKNNSEKKTKIEEFIKYLPVLQITDNNMMELDAENILKYEYKELDITGVINRFSSSKTILLNDEVMYSIIENKEIFDKIFKNIKKYTAFNEKSNKEDVNVEILNISQEKIKNIKCKKAKNKIDNKPEDDTLSKEEKEEKKIFDKEKKKILELLKTVLARIPLFMYLTDASEENLTEVLEENNERELFRQATGISTNDFKELIKIKAIKVDSMEGYILKFKEFEDNNFKYLNNTLKQTINNYD